MKNGPLVRILWKVKSRETCWKIVDEKAKVTEELGVSCKEGQISRNDDQQYQSWK